ncbi:MAG: PhzF family phenazine biosynthesis protein [Phormidesmis sp.]
MSLKIVQVDAFTDKPFGGNPAAVCVTEGPLEDAKMQAIAAEMNLSETAFLHPLGNTEADGFSIRWFSPTTEVDLCGHATLASAHTLWSEGYLSEGTAAKFKSRRAGWLGAQQQANGWIELDFPEQPVKPAHVMPQLVKSLCCQGDIRTVTKSQSNYLVETHSEKSVRAMTPDFVELKKLPVQGVIVTAAAEDPSYDFVSRYFCPSIGINEDPVTGFAHTSLAPYWQEKLGKSVMLAQQVSARGGVIQVDCTKTDRVLISGQALTVMRGDLLA